MTHTVVNLSRGLSWGGNFLNIIKNVHLMLTYWITLNL